MKLTTLTNKALISLQTQFESREEAIHALADQLDQQGKLHDKQAYLDAVFEREEQGPTALGEGLAVPHGKTDAVKEAGFAVATLKRDLKWKGIDEDEDEDVNLVFLIAIPNAEAGSTHMHLLTALTTTLVDDDIRNAVLQATTPDEIMVLLDSNDNEQQNSNINNNTNQHNDQPTIVCVTACPAGIAHTYMAAEYLEKAGKKLGIKVPTPDSQMRGKLVCRFGLFGFKGDHITANVMQNARDYVTPIHSYNKIPYNAMKLNVGEQNLPMTYSLLEKDMRGAVLSVLKKAEDEDALILRVYNPSETETITDAVHFNRPVTEWIETQMDEVVLTDSTPANSQFGELGQCQAKTFRVRF